jgi:succinate dehydrogenase / fumarate reductase membrane anchor subunit
MRFRTPLNNARGLGAAKDGTHHWWMQRVTAVALLPLTLWLAVSLAQLSGMSYDEARAWLSSPLVAVLVLATVWALFYHAMLGLQVVIEDYIATNSLRLTCLLASKFALILLGLACGLAVLKTFLGA